VAAELQLEAQLGRQRIALEATRPIQVNTSRVQPGGEPG